MKHIHVCGGTEKFHSFLSAVSDGNLTVHQNPGGLSAVSGPDQVVFLLPDYERKDAFIPKQSFRWVETMLKNASAGTRFYIENYWTSDYQHPQFSVFQTVNGPRSFYQEYILPGKQFDRFFPQKQKNGWQDILLQARNGFYIPAVIRMMQYEVLVSASTVIGTHSCYANPRGWSMHILARNKNGNIYSAVSDFSAFDPLFRRPYALWKNFICGLIQMVTELNFEHIEKAFEAVYPDAITLAGTGNTPEQAVRSALKWHQNSGILEREDGSEGAYEMITSCDLSVRSNLRGDAGVITAALFASAGRIFQDPALIAAGKNIIDFLLDRGIQRPDGLFRWFSYTDEVYPSDTSRCGLGILQLWKTTGDKRYRTAALRLADALLKWLEPNGLCCSHFIGDTIPADAPTHDNPCFYGEMGAFLFQLKEEKYTRAALRIAEIIRKKFPDVAPYGFCKTFGFSRWIVFLASAQYHSNVDFSRDIEFILDYFSPLLEAEGAFRETAIEGLEHGSESGVAIGDGSDRIADILYCNINMLNALSILVRLPERRQDGLNMERISRMYQNLRNFFLKKQIHSHDKRLDGGWMRAFDLDLDEYYGLNKDIDWGPYCIMGGWVMGFVPFALLYDGKKESLFT